MRGKAMQQVRITDKLTVAVQPRLEEFPRFAEDGFATIINNRPDGEEAGQPGTAAENAAASDAGLGYAHIPVTMAAISEADVRAFQSVVDKAAGPVLAHCKGGARALTLHVLGEVLDGRMIARDVRVF